MQQPGSAERVDDVGRGERGSVGERHVGPHVQRVGGEIGAHVDGGEGAVGDAVRRRRVDLAEGRVDQPRAHVVQRGRADQVGERLCRAAAGEGRAERAAGRGGVGGRRGGRRATGRSGRDREGEQRRDDRGMPPGERGHGILRAAAWGSARWHGSRCRLAAYRESFSQPSTPTPLGGRVGSAGTRGDRARRAASGAAGTDPRLSPRAPCGSAAATPARPSAGAGRRG